MAQTYTVTASTSIVRIASLAAPNTVVLLSSITYPGHIVGIQDITGDPLIASYPIVVSTTQGIFFQDATFSTLITQPFGSLSLSSKTPTRWQLLNNTGFLTSLSNAFLQDLSVSYGFANLISAPLEFVSTSVIGRIDITNSIELGGNTQIIGDITVGGNVDFFSTLDVFQRLSLSSGLTVAGDFVSLSSVLIQGNLDIQGFLSTPSSLIANQSVYVNQNVFAERALLAKHLSVQTLRVSTLTIAGGLRASGDVAIQSQLSVGLDLISLGSTSIQSTLTVGSTLAIYDSLYAQSSFVGQSLLTLGHVSVAKEVYVQGTATVSSFASSFAEMIFASTAVISSTTVAGDDVFVRDLSIFKTLDVLGTANISSFQAFSTVNIQSNALSYGGSITVEKDFRIQGTLGVGRDFIANTSYLSVSTSISSFGSTGIGGSLTIGRDLVVGKTTVVEGSLLGISSLRVNGTVSTGFLTAQSQLTVLEGLSVGKVLGTSTLGAPISLTIDTLSLSNSLRISAEGIVPNLDAHELPKRFVVGLGFSNIDKDITVEGILNNRSTIQQTNYPDYTKLWYATDVKASTVSMSSLLSTAFVGPISDTKPFLTNYGSIVVGDFPASDSIFYSSNISTNYSAAINGFSGGFFPGGTKVAYGDSRWVAVGGGTTSLESIRTSPDGYSWTSAVSGGFGSGGLDVAYGGGKWIAVGQPSFPEASIQYSTDGSTWTNSLNAFGIAARSIAYNGTNLWVAAGESFQFGIKYSVDGVVWSDATLVPPIQFRGVGVGYGNGLWIASDNQSLFVTSTDGINWTIGGYLARNSFAYNGSYWIAGGAALSGDPTTSIQISADGFLWALIATGGFTGGCTDVAWDSSNDLWWATGYMSPSGLPVLQYSVNGFEWMPATFLTIGTAKGIAFGSIRVPDTDTYFTVNMTTIFRSTLSSTALFVSSVQASTIYSDGFLGDGAGLSNITNFRNAVFTSSFLAGSAVGVDLFAQRLRTDFLQVSDSLYVRENTFISSINLWVAAGADSEPNGNIQTSLTGRNWIRGTGPTFEFYSRAVVGNSNEISPLFVAVGADSRTFYTIQWSLDARTWFPITSGGFDIASDGIKQGNSVAYNSNLNIWVAAGINQGTPSTLFYSVDTQNWLCASNAFVDYASFVAASVTGFVAIGSSGSKYSADGITWLDSAPSIQFDTVGYGSVNLFTLPFTGWLGVFNTTLYFSGDGGATWVPTGCNSLQRMVSVVYNGQNWVGVGCNTIQYSSKADSWSTVVTTFAPDTIFNSVAYNTNQDRWVAGAVSTTADKSLWSSSNLIDWSASLSGGFSTSVITAGRGFGIFTSSLYTFAVGQTSFNGITGVQQAILNVSSTATGSTNFVTSNSLSPENTLNVFRSQVRGIYGAADELYSYVAVGDGEVPQKTIARSQTGAANTWIPAVTGGFSTTGYGVTYYVDRWIAVGDTQASTNTIQYSPDGANWFGTNSGHALRQGGRGIAEGIGTLAGRLVAVGADVLNSTIAISLDGYVWSTTKGSYFRPQGNAVASGNDGVANNFVAVGTDSRGAPSTILRSSDGVAWSNVDSGGFSGGGFGIAYGDISGSKFYVAVGSDADSSKTIQYSIDGARNFSPVVSGAFTGAGYGVAFNPSSNLFFAVGEDVGAFRNATIKFSGDAANWSNISSIAGFRSQTTLGAAYGVFTQGIQITETIPYLDFVNLTIYPRTEPLLYPRATLRIQSSFMTFNESLYINLSSQVIVSSNVPYSSNAVLTVYGDIYASSFIYTGPLLSTDTLLVSSLVVSTLSSFLTMNSRYLTTPNLAINTLESKANRILGYSAGIFSAYDSSNYSTGVLNVNDTLFTTANIPSFQQTGIGKSTPHYHLDIQGSFGTSSFSTTYLFSPPIVRSLASNTNNIQDSYFSLVSGNETDIIKQRNSILTTPSSMILNSVVVLNLSSQKVGVYTKDPQFLLDVRAQTYLQTLSTPLVNTSLLFLTLQSA